MHIHTLALYLMQGLYQKAETMYAMGDFEYALVFYHRGDKIRPDIKAFKLGIQKAQEAINNSIGCECRAMYCTGISALSCAQEGFHMFSSKCKVQSRLLYIHTVMVHTHNILQRKLSQMILKPILFSSVSSLFQLLLPASWTRRETSLSFNSRT